MSFQFRAATWLVVVAMIVLVGTSAQAEEPSRDWLDEPIELSDQYPRGGPFDDSSDERIELNDSVQLDGRWVDYDDEEAFEDEEDPMWIGFDSLFFGGGVRGVTHAGRERAFNSEFGFAGYSIRNQGWELIDNEVWLQLGLYLTAEASRYQSRYFKGETQRYGAGAEFTLIDMPEQGSEGADRLSKWSFTWRFLIAYDLEKGESRTGNGYKLYHQDTTLVRLNGQVELYALFQQSAVRHARNGVVVREGLFPTVALLFDVVQPLHSTRSSSASRQGFSDPPSKKDRQSVTARVVVYRGAWRQGLYDIGFDVGGSWYRAAGYNSMPDGRRTEAIYAGLYTRLQLAEDIFFYLTGGYEQETATHRGALLATASIEVVGLARGIERFLRGGAGDD